MHFLCAFFSKECLKSTSFHNPPFFAGMKYSASHSSEMRCVNRPHIPTTTSAGTNKQHFKLTDHTQIDVWSEEQVKVAHKIVQRQNAQKQLSKFWQEKMEINASLNWNKFYQNNGVNFFKVTNFFLSFLPAAQMPTFGRIGTT